MKIKLILLTCIVFVLYVNKATARSKEDTIYYLLDTVSTPVRDRIVTTDIDGNYKFVRINCHCMKNYETPVFSFNVKQGIPLKRKVFKSLNLLTLVRLMELTRAVNSVDFKIRHVLYIIEPKGKDYVIYRSFAESREIITGY